MPSSARAAARSTVAAESGRRADDRRRPRARRARDRNPARTGTGTAPGPPTRRWCAPVPAARPRPADSRTARCARPCALELPREPQVEFLVVDADEHVGPPFEDPPPQIARAAACRRGRCVRTSVSPMTAELLDVVPGRATGGPHPRARDARELGLRKSPAQRLDERGAQRVTGCLARHQCDAQCATPVR